MTQRNSVREPVYGLRRNNERLARGVSLCLLVPRGASTRVSSAMDSKFFSAEEEEILIDLIGEYPPLYSFKNEAFKDKELKATIWRKIADSMGKNEDACKTKWKNLRDYYMKKKREGTLPTNSATPGSSRKYDKYLKMKFLELETTDSRSANNTDTSMVSEEENSLIQQEMYDHPSMKDIHLRQYEHHASGSADEPDGTFISEESCPQPYKRAKLDSQLRLARHQLLVEYQRASRDRMEANGEIQPQKNRAFIYGDPSDMHLQKTTITYGDPTEIRTITTSHGDPLEDFFCGIITTVKTFTPELQLRAKRSISNIVFDLEQEALSHKIHMSNVMVKTDQ